MPALIQFLKAILPTKKIGAWILGLLAALVALLLGVNGAELKSEFCSSGTSLPEIPKLAPVTAPAAAAAVQAVKSVPVAPVGIPSDVVKALKK